MPFVNEPTDPRYEEMITLKLDEGLGYKAIATRLGMSQNTVKGWMRYWNAHGQRPPKITKESGLGTETGGVTPEAGADDEAIAHTTVTAEIPIDLGAYRERIKAAGPGAGGKTPKGGNEGGGNGAGGGGGDFISELFEAIAIQQALRLADLLQRMGPDDRPGMEIVEGLSLVHALMPGKQSISVTASLNTLTKAIQIRENSGGDAIAGLTHEERANELVKLGFSSREEPDNRDGVGAGNEEIQALTDEQLTEKLMGLLGQRPA